VTFTLIDDAITCLIEGMHSAVAGILMRTFGRFTVL
jgi:hypothetical protein